MYVVYLLLICLTLNILFQMLLVGIIKMIAEEHRICLFIDDLNNADLSSLELIVMLLTQCSSSRLTFVVTYREECLASSTHSLTVTLPMLEQFSTKFFKFILYFIFFLFFF